MRSFSARTLGGIDPATAVKGDFETMASGTRRYPELCPSCGETGRRGGWQRAFSPVDWLAGLRLLWPSIRVERCEGGAGPNRRTERLRPDPIVRVLPASPRHAPVSDPCRLVGGPYPACPSGSGWLAPRPLPRRSQSRLGSRSIRHSRLQPSIRTSSRKRLSVYVAQQFSIWHSWGSWASKPRGSRGQFLRSNSSFGLRGPHALCRSQEQAARFRRLNFARGDHGSVRPHHAHRRRRRLQPGASLDAALRSSPSRPPRPPRRPQRGAAQPELPAQRRPALAACSQRRTAHLPAHFPISSSTSAQT